MTVVEIQEGSKYYSNYGNIQIYKNIQKMDTEIISNNKYYPIDI